MRSAALLHELGREDIERSIGDAVEGEEEGWCYYLDAKLSEHEDDPDWEADELLEWRVVELWKAGAVLVRLSRASSSSRIRPRTTRAALVYSSSRWFSSDGSGWSVPVCEPVCTGVLDAELPAALAYCEESCGAAEALEHRPRAKGRSGSPDPIGFR